jgi:hypothetical protein
MIASLLVAGCILWAYIFPEEMAQVLTIAGFALIMGACSGARIEQLRR